MKNNQNTTENKEKRLTPEQEMCISDRGHNLLVSASAGSGKTFVMIKRIADMIINKEVSVSDILVVTFTKAAAGEMKARLLTSLEKVEPKSDYIKEQLLEVNSASICTLHSFCSRMLKTYFYVLGIDPAFTLIDEVESKTLKDRAFAKLIDNAFTQNDQDFFELLDMFSVNRKEDNFKSAIFKFYEFMLSQVDAQGWFEKTLESAYTTDLSQNCCANFLNAVFIKRFSDLKQKAEDLLSSGDILSNQKVVTYINALYLSLLTIKPNNNFLENAKSFSNREKLPNMPTLKDEFEYLKPIVNKFKESVKKAISEAEEVYLQEEDNYTIKKLKATKKYVENLYNCVLNFKTNYAELKRERVALDFSDLEQYMLELLKHQEIRLALKDKYKFIFVDEYQDTNAVQEAILSGVAGYNNLFMVGDVKQSIYRFRASEPQIFVDKYNNYSKNDLENSKAINLNANFRSYKEILEFSNEVFSRAMTSEFGGVNYAKDAMFVSGAGEGQRFTGQYPIVSVEMIQTKTKSEKQEEEEGELLPPYSVVNHHDEDEENIKKAESEGTIVAEKIKEILKTDIVKDKNEKLKVCYKDIAILSSARGEYLKTILAQLDKAGIPYACDIKENIFENEDLNALKSLIELVDNRHQDVPLFSFLQSNFSEFTIDELSKIRQSNREAKFFYEAFYGAQSNENVPISLKGKVKRFCDLINKMHFYSQYLQVDALIKKIVEMINFEIIVLKKNGGEKTIANLKNLIAFLNGKSYNASVYQFLQNIKENEILFENEISENSIKVTTIHQSKGLEYPVVVLVGAGQPLISRKSLSDFIASKDLGVGIPYFDIINRTKSDTVCFNAIKYQNIYQNLEEKLRLLYVALTRAKNHMIIVGCTGNELDEVEASQAKSFLGWINPVILAKQNGGLATFNDFCTQIHDIANIKVIDAQDKIKKIVFEEPSKKMLDNIEQVLNFAYPFTNSTSLPVKTSVSEILQQEKDQAFVPKIYSEGNEEAAKRGTAYHKILQYIDLSKRQKVDFDEEIKRLMTDRVLSEEEVSLVDLNKIRRLLNDEFFISLQGGKVYREQEFIALTKPSSKNVGLNSQDNMLVQGIVDFIAVTPKGAYVVDFKTNNWHNAEQFKNVYASQLDIYSKVVAESYGIKILGKYIYSFSLDGFVKV